MAAEKATPQPTRRPASARKVDARQPMPLRPVGTYVPPRSPEGLVVTFRKGEPVINRDRPAS